MKSRRPHTEEARRKMSESHKGISTWNKGLCARCHGVFDKERGLRGHGKSY